LRRRALELAELNPTLSMSRIALHMGVSLPTVSRWFREAPLKRWF